MNGRLKKKWATITLVIVLGGCAKDHYTVIPGGNGSPDRMSDDLYDCKMAAIHEYNEGGPNAGTFAAGALGGAIGGALMGATSDLPNDKGMKPSDINPAVGKCMRQKGYEGTSQ